MADRRQRSVEVGRGAPALPGTSGVSFLALGVLAVLTACSEEARQDPGPAAGSQQLPPSGVPAVDVEGEPTTFPVVGLAILWPAGFESERRTTGFVDPETKASILLQKVPSPYDEVLAGMDPTVAATRRNLMLKTSEEVDIDGVTGTLFGGQQGMQGTVFGKWILMFPAVDGTALVEASYPLSRETDMGRMLKTVVLSTRPDRPAPGAEVTMEFDIRSDRLRPTPGFGKMIVYARGGIAPGPTDPFFIAGVTPTAVAADDRTEFARSRARREAELQIDSEGPLEVDGLPGYEIVGTGVDDGGRPTVVYHAMLFTADAYVSMRGVTPKHMSGMFLPEFKAMTRSFERRR